MHACIQLFVLLTILLTLVVYSTAGSCTDDQKCELHEWVNWNCTACCKPNASPYSAVRKRKICCPGQGLTLVTCLDLCNRTNDEVEMNGSCTTHCGGKCTNGFHFRTTSTPKTSTQTTTSTTQSTTRPSTKLSSTTTSTTQSTTRPSTKLSSTTTSTTQSTTRPSTKLSSTTTSTTQSTTRPSIKLPSTTTSTTQSTTRPSTKLLSTTTSTTQSTTQSSTKLPSTTTSTTLKPTSTKLRKITTVTTSSTVKTTASFKPTNKPTTATSETTSTTSSSNTNIKATNKNINTGPRPSPTTLQHTSRSLNRHNASIHKTTKIVLSKMLAPSSTTVTTTTLKQTYSTPISSTTILSAPTQRTTKENRNKPPRKTARPQPGNTEGPKDLQTTGVLMSTVSGTSTNFIGSSKDAESVTKTSHGPVSPLLNIASGNRSTTDHNGVNTTKGQSVQCYTVESENKTVNGALLNACLFIAGLLVGAFATILWYYLLKRRGQRVGAKQNSTGTANSDHKHVISGMGSNSEMDQSRGGVLKPLDF